MRVVPVLNVSGVGTCSADPKVSHNAKATSFANVLNLKRTTSKINFRPLINEVRVENHDTTLPKAIMKSILCRYVNTFDGYFVGTTIAFPIVQNYVTNTWGKFGLNERSLWSNGNMIHVTTMIMKMITLMIVVYLRPN